MTADGRGRGRGSAATRARAAARLGKGAESRDPFAEAFAAAKKAADAAKKAGDDATNDASSEEASESASSSDSASSSSPDPSSFVNPPNANGGDLDEVLAWNLPLVDPENPVGFFDFTDADPDAGPSSYFRAIEDPSTVLAAALRGDDADAASADAADEFDAFESYPFRRDGSLVEGGFGSEKEGQGRFARISNPARRFGRRARRYVSGLEWTAPKAAFAGVGLALFSLTMFACFLETVFLGLESMAERRRARRGNEEELVGLTSSNGARMPRGFGGWDRDEESGGKGFGRGYGGF